MVWEVRPRTSRIREVGAPSGNRTASQWLVWCSGGSRAATYLTRITPSTGEATSFLGCHPARHGRVRVHRLWSRAVKTARLSRNGAEMGEDT